MKHFLYILALTAISQTAFAGDKVLMVITAATEQQLQNGKIRQTGFFLNEFYDAYKGLAAAGYEIDFASPGGTKPEIDSESLKDKYWESKELKDEAIQFVATHHGINSPRTLSEAIQLHADYVGMVVPGGQGVMVDLIDDAQVIELIVSFSKAGKPIGLICHAPALLLKIPASQNPFVGYTVTSISTIEELFIESFIMGGKARNRMISSQLTDAGYDDRHAFPGRGFAVRDRELITSQNPYSSKKFNALFLKALVEYKDSGSLRKMLRRKKP